MTLDSWLLTLDQHMSTQVRNKRLGFLFGLFAHASQNWPKSIFAQHRCISWHVRILIGMIEQAKHCAHKTDLTKEFNLHHTLDKHEARVRLCSSLRLVLVRPCCRGVRYRRLWSDVSVLVVRSVSEQISKTNLLKGSFSPHKTYPCLIFVTVTGGRASQAVVEDTVFKTRHLILLAMEETATKPTQSNHPAMEETATKPVQWAPNASAGGVHALLLRRRAVISGPDFLGRGWVWGVLFLWSREPLVIIIDVSKSYTCCACRGMQILLENY